MLQTVIPASGDSEHSILIPALPEVIWSVIIVAVIFIVMMKVVYPAYQKYSDERTSRIKEGLENAEQAEQKLKNADAKALALVQAAQKEASEIRSEAHETAKKIVATAKTDANKEAERIAANAQRQIEVERQSAEISLRTEVGLLAADLAENIVGEQLKDRELSARVVDRFLDELEQNAKAGQTAQGASSEGVLN